MTREPIPEPESSELDTPVATADLSLVYTPATQSPLKRANPSRRLFVAPAWFLLGVIVGLGAFAAYSQFTAKPAPPPMIDQAAVQGAAREGFLEGIATLQAQSASGGPSQNSTPAPVSNDAFAVRAANRLGNESAKVMLVEYADYQCPFCGRHHQLVAPRVNQEYVESGKVTFVYKHMAFLGDESIYAAIASECAADQGKFWEYHDSLFEHQQGENEGAFLPNKLVGFGKELNLDMPRFEKCVQDSETFARVRADTEEGRKLGVNSTPTFFVNGQPLVGLQSYEALKAEIEKALAQ